MLSLLQKPENGHLCHGELVEPHNEINDIQAPFDKLRVTKRDFCKSLCCLIFVFLSALLVGGCGYTMHGKASLPFTSITIGKIINKTFEPGLEDRMQLALVDELMKDGFSIDNSGQNRIDGVINAFELRTLSTKSGVAVEYEVVVRGDFRLTEATGKTRPLRNSGVYIVSFLSTDSLQGVMAMKEKAIERALSDLSSEIAASIMY